jgi:D-alanyl-D-alanine carboxypeptidase
MTRLPRFGSALSALALASVLAGCAGPTRQSHSINLNKSDVGLAMKAQLALAGGDFRAATAFAEKAVEGKPDDSGMRVLLGNTYFGSGRFASAETAYRDALTLLSNQPQTILKLALAQIAQGKNAEALSFLGAARDVLEPADYGLALALAGQPAEAVAVLEPAARAPGADARLRQNLALALGLSGDWGAARIVASQDLSADQVDGRVRQWMTLAKPVRASDQVAALVGVTPAAADPGVPVRLALRDSQQRLAQAAVPAPVPAPAAAPAPAADVAWSGAASPATAAEAPPFAPMNPAEEPAVAVAAADLPARSAFAMPAAEEVVAAAASAPDEPTAAPLVAALAPVSVRERTIPVRKAAAASRGRGKAGVVVQLGAYRSPTRVETAWNQFSGRHGALRDYTPSSARFHGPQGTVYRLSVRGFTSLREAQGLCASLRAKGQGCFVRQVAGDAPAQFASRRG